MEGHVLNKRVLFIGHLAYIIAQFNIPNIKLLKGLGYEVDVACNSCSEANALLSTEKINAFKETLNFLDCRLFQVDFNRSPIHIYQNFKAYKQIQKILIENKYEMIHCHSPIGGLIGRLAANKYRQNGLKVIYTVHGFHFFKGAPIKNWLIYYPIEKFCSHFTDTLITINHEDYELARKKMKAKRVEYVPGVGIDVDKFKNVTVDRVAKRNDLGIPEDAFLLLSVGELNENKNHQIIIKALAKLNDPNIHYAIAGMGGKREFLLEVAKKLGVEDRVHLLGYRTDIAALNHISNAFCFPSYREGLGLAALEAMACSLPLITSNVHGINDYSQDEMTGYKFAPDDVDGFSSAIQKLCYDPELCARIGAYNRELVKKYDIDNITKIMMERIYR